jgi:hypothetical protein
VAPQPPVAPTPLPLTQNISSDEIEQDEVNKIAAELKHELDKKAETKPAPKTEATFELQSGKDDTIYIDREGNFNLKDK